MVNEYKRRVGSLTRSTLAKGLRVVLFSPKDVDGLTLSDHLRRIGCTVDAYWPPLPEIPENADLIFLAVTPEAQEIEYPWLARNPPPIISIVTFENPTIIDEALRIGVMGIITTPIRPSGLLSTVVMALSHAKRYAEKASRIVRLEEKITHLRQLGEAKNILMKMHSVSEIEAYEILRNQAMSQRSTIEAIAIDIIRAHAVLHRTLPARDGSTKGS
jgi:AmiR/NasT family two-component response regulator